MASIANWYAKAGQFGLTMCEIGDAKARMLRDKKQRNCPNFRSRVRVWFKIMNGELADRQNK